MILLGPWRINREDKGHSARDGRTVRGLRRSLRRTVSPGATPQQRTLIPAPVTVRVSAACPGLAGPTTPTANTSTGPPAAGTQNHLSRNLRVPWNPGILDFIIPFSHPGSARPVPPGPPVSTTYSLPLLRLPLLLDHVLDLNLEPSRTASICRPPPFLFTLRSPAVAASCAFSIANPPRGPTTRLHDCPCLRLRGYKSPT